VIDSLYIPELPMVKVPATKLTWDWPRARALSISKLGVLCSSTMTQITKTMYQSRIDIREARVEEGQHSRDRHSETYALANTYGYINVCLSTISNVHRMVQL